MNENNMDKEVYRIIGGVDLSINNPSLIHTANCIMARENRGISKIQSIGNGVVMEIIKEFPE